MFNLNTSNGIEWIINDESACLYVIRGAFEYSGQLYNLIYNETIWNQEIVYMAGNKYITNRFTSVVGIKGLNFRYSGKDMISNGWSPTVETINSVISNAMNYGFNFCLLNYYPDGTTKLGFHSDDESSMVSGSPIVSLSLGAERDFQVQPRSKLGNIKWDEMGLSGTLNIKASSGDIIVMSGAMQKNYKHAIPKRMKVKDPRISLTYRNMQNMNYY